MMPSERKLAPNRNNAKRSTGPRPARGKSRASRNALRHGLATTAQRIPAALALIERMAKAICGDGATRSQYEQALNIAESDHMICGVRATRLAPIKRVTIAPQERKTYSGQPQREEDGPQTAPEQQSAPEIYDEVAAFQQALPDMTRYDRYERRALSRRQRA